MITKQNAREVANRLIALGLCEEAEDKLKSPTFGGRDLLAIASSYQGAHYLRKHPEVLEWKEWGHFLREELRPYGIFMMQDNGFIAPRQTLSTVLASGKGTEVTVKARGAIAVRCFALNGAKIIIDADWYPIVSVFTHQKGDPWGEVVKCANGAAVKINPI